MSAIWKVGDGWQALRTCLCRWCRHATFCEQADCHRHYCLVWQARGLRKENR